MEHSKDEIIYAQYREPVLNDCKIYRTFLQRHVPFENLGDGARRIIPIRSGEWAVYGASHG